MNAPIAVPVYQPSPYALAGRPFDALPPAAQTYLHEIDLAPPAEYNPDAVAYRRTLRAEELFRSLEGTNIALVEKRLETRAISQQAERSEEWYRDAARMDQDRVHEVAGILLPERQRHMDQFMMEFDALVWLELNARGESGERWSVEEQRAHRDALCAPILEHTRQQLLALDNDVMRQAALKEEEANSPHKAGNEFDSPHERMVRDIQNLLLHSPTADMEFPDHTAETRKRPRRGRHTQ